MVRLRVKEIAETNGFNMSSLSRSANISFNTVKRIFRDPYRETSTTVLEKLAKALGISTAELIENVPDTTDLGTISALLIGRVRACGASRQVLTSRGIVVYNA
jgi:lambda repressor-like predicted transcriptional regulator